MALFKLGAIVATPGALQFCEEHSIDPLALIGRHVGGDFGDLDAGDVAANVHGIKHWVFWDTVTGDSGGS